LLFHARGCGAALVQPPWGSDMRSLALVHRPHARRLHLAAFSFPSSVPKHDPIPANAFHRRRARKRAICAGLENRSPANGPGHGTVLEALTWPLLYRCVTALFGVFPDMFPSVFLTRENPPDLSRLHQNSKRLDRAKNTCTVTLCNQEVSGSIPEAGFAKMAHSAIRN
jgi:hypothetical protein